MSAAVALALIAFVHATTRNVSDYAQLQNALQDAGEAAPIVILQTISLPLPSSPDPTSFVLDFGHRTLQFNSNSSSSSTPTQLFDVSNVVRTVTGSSWQLTLRNGRFELPAAMWLVDVQLDGQSFMTATSPRLSLENIVGAESNNGSLARFGCLHCEYSFDGISGSWRSIFEVSAAFGAISVLNSNTTCGNGSSGAAGTPTAPLTTCIMCADARTLRIANSSIRGCDNSKMSFRSFTQLELLDSAFTASVVEVSTALDARVDRCRFENSVNAPTLNVTNSSTLIVNNSTFQSTSTPTNAFFARAIHLDTGQQTTALNIANCSASGFVSLLRVQSSTNRSVMATLSRIRLHNGTSLVDFGATGVVEANDVVFNGTLLRPLAQFASASVSFTNISLFGLATLANMSASASVFYVRSSTSVKRGETRTLSFANVNVDGGLMTSLIDLDSDAQSIFSFTDFVIGDGARFNASCFKMARVYNVTIARGVVRANINGRVFEAMSATSVKITDILVDSDSAPMSGADANSSVTVATYKAFVSIVNTVSVELNRIHVAFDGKWIVPTALCTRNVSPAYFGNLSKLTIDNLNWADISYSCNGASFASSIVIEDVANVRLRNSTVRGVQSATSAVSFVSCSNVTLKSCTFANNRALALREQGGALYCFNENTLTNLEIRDSLFSNNTSLDSGGAIGASQCTMNVVNTAFTGNTVLNSTATGGAIWSEAETELPVQFVASNSLFQNNSISGAAGSAILLQNTEVDISNSDFRNNTNSASSASVLIVENDESWLGVRISSSSFSGNVFGGFVDLDDVANITINTVCICSPGFGSMPTSGLVCDADLRPNDSRITIANLTVHNGSSIHCATVAGLQGSAFPLCSAAGVCPSATTISHSFTPPLAARPLEPRPAEQPPVRTTATTAAATTATATATTATTTTATTTTAITVPMSMPAVGTKIEGPTDTVHTNTTALIGGVIGGVLGALLLAVVVIIAVCVVRWRRQRPRAATNSAEIHEYGRIVLPTSNYNESEFNHLQ